MRFDVPLVPDEAYLRFLNKRQDRLSSVHFSLYHPRLADARQRWETPSRQSLVSALQSLPGIPRFALLNSRVHAPDTYFDKSTLEIAARELSRLVDEADLTGIIYADAYYLQALGEAFPDLATRLEAVPSINALLDSAERVFATLDIIDTTPFRTPSKLVLDRNLNRDLSRLEREVSVIKTHLPDMQLNLMANEGCLFHCPFKLAHDSQIAMITEGLCPDRTFAINREFGCIRRFLTDHAAFLTSPFIRPEDLPAYAPLVDGIKLCGRNKGTNFLRNVIDAYETGRYQGNLLDLMDAMGDLADRVHVDNAALGDDFIDRTGHCDKACRSCGWCARVAETAVTRRTPSL